jgi:hypothetical protein
VISANTLLAIDSASLGATAPFERLLVIGFDVGAADGIE